MPIQMHLFFLQMYMIFVAFGLLLSYFDIELTNMIRHCVLAYPWGTSIKMQRNSMYSFTISFNTTHETADVYVKGEV